MALTSSGGGGGTQLIGGKLYDIGSPEWQAATQQDKVAQAGTVGTAEGTREGNAISANPYAKDLFGQLDSAIGSLTGPNGSMGGGTSATSGSPVPASISMGGGSVGGAVPGSADLDAANSASFAAAKSKAGQIGRSSVDALQEEMAARGIAGSGTQGRGLVSRLAAVTNPLADENVAELNKKVDLNTHAGDLAASAAKTNYEGQIAQRGQDIGMQEANAQIASQRQLALSAMLSKALGSFNVNMGMSY